MFKRCRFIFHRVASVRDSPADERSLSIACKRIELLKSIWQCLTEHCVVYFWCAFVISYKIPHIYYFNTPLSDIVKVGSWGVV